MPNACRHHPVSSAPGIINSPLLTRGSRAASRFLGRDGGGDTVRSEPTLETPSLLLILPLGNSQPSQLGNRICCDPGVLPCQQCPPHPPLLLRAIAGGIDGQGYRHCHHRAVRVLGGAGHPGAFPWNQKSRRAPVFHQQTGPKIAHWAGQSRGLGRPVPLALARE